MHTSFPKGTTIFIIMKDGQTTTGKFADHKSGKVFLEDGRAVELKNVRAMSPRRLESDSGSSGREKIKFRI